MFDRKQSSPVRSSDHGPVQAVGADTAPTFTTNIQKVRTLSVSSPVLIIRPNPLLISGVVLKVKMIYQVIESGLNEICRVDCREV